jgi:hypothetical protein
MVSGARLTYRPDGWPLCPECGEDELGCRATPPPFGGKREGTWTFLEAMTWYRCGKVTLEVGW